VEHSHRRNLCGSTIFRLHEVHHCELEPKPENCSVPAFRLQIFVPDFSVEAVLASLEPELTIASHRRSLKKSPAAEGSRVMKKARRAGRRAGHDQIQLRPAQNLLLRSSLLPAGTAAHAALLDCAQSVSPRYRRHCSRIQFFSIFSGTIESLFGSHAQDWRVTSFVEPSEPGPGSECKRHRFQSEPPFAAALGFSGVTGDSRRKEAERIGQFAR